MTPLRRIGFANLLALAVLASTIGGSIATAQPMPVPAKGLDGVLFDWEKAMEKVVAFEGQVARKDTSALFDTTEVLEGRVRILKTEQTGILASLELARKDDPSIQEKLLLNNRGFCQYDFRAKEVRIHPLAIRPDRSDNPLSFLFGIKAFDLKTRFDLTLAGQDQHYIYIAVMPKTDADKAGFAKARVSLYRSSSMPAQLWFQQVNRNTTQWDMAPPNLRPALNPNDFGMTIPQGWRAIEAPRPKSAADRQATTLPPALK